MSEPNPIGDSRDKATGHLTLALTVAARFVEVHLHRRAQEARAEEQRVLQAARAAEQQTRAEAAVVKYDLRDVGRKEWWDTAAVEQVAGGYAAARAYARVDPELAGVARHMGEEIRSRYGIDAEQLVAANEESVRAFLDRGIRPPEVRLVPGEEIEVITRVQDYVDSIDTRGVETAAANDPTYEDNAMAYKEALDRMNAVNGIGTVDGPLPTRPEAEAEVERTRTAMFDGPAPTGNEQDPWTAARARREVGEAVTLMAEANAVDLLVHNDGVVTKSEAAHDVPRAESGWDDAARHQALADRLATSGLPEAAVETRLIADVAQGTPVAAAPAAAGQGQGGAKRPQTAAQRVPERGLGR